MTNNIFLLVFIFLISCTMSLIDIIKIEKDSRELIDFGGFGFAKGGIQTITMHNLAVDVESDGDLYPTQQQINDNIGFFVKVGDTKVDTEIQGIPPGSCLLTPSGSTSVGLEGSFDYSLIEWCPEGYCTSDPQSSTVDQTHSVTKAGWYHLYFVNCLRSFVFHNQSVDSITVSFQLNVTQKNPDGHFLSIGNIPLPWTFGILSLVALSGSIFWVHYILKCKQQPANSVDKIHWAMLCVPIFNSFVMATRAIEYHTMDTFGEPLGWDVPFYIFTILGTISFFVVVALLSTGWSIFKAYLTDKDKKLIAFLIPLQLFANIAFIVIDATSESVQGWSTWLYLAIIVDIACFLGLIIPIQNSLKHLKDTSLDDEKSSQSLVKYNQLSNLYGSLLAFVYIGRVVAYWLEISLNYDIIWIAALVSELTLLSLYSYIGYIFRPQALYLLMVEDDMGDMEMPSLSVFDDDHDLFHRSGNVNSSGNTSGNIESGTDSTLVSKTLRGESGMIHHAPISRTNVNMNGNGLTTSNTLSNTDVENSQGAENLPEDPFTVAMTPPNLLHGFEESEDNELDELLTL